LNQKPINVIDCIKAVDGEVHVPRVDSLKRHVLKRFQKVNSFESSILKDLSEKVSILYPNIDGVSNTCNCREKGITNKDFLYTFGKMIKNKTLKEVHNYFIEILGFDTTALIQSITFFGFWFKNWFLSNSAPTRR
jgi:hypothetical protein